MNKFISLEIGSDPIPVFILRHSSGLHEYEETVLESGIQLYHELTLFKIFIHINSFLDKINKLDLTRERFHISYEFSELDGDVYVVLSISGMLKKGLFQCKRFASSDRGELLKTAEEFINYVADTLPKKEALEKVKVSDVHK